MPSSWLTPPGKPTDVPVEVINFFNYKFLGCCARYEQIPLLLTKEKLSIAVRLGGTSRSTKLDSSETPMKHLPKQEARSGPTGELS